MGEPTNGELPLISILRAPEELPLEVIATFGDDEDAAVRAAIEYAWRNRRVRGMTQRLAAEACDMKAQHFCNVLMGRKYLPLQKLNRFEAVLGNTAVSQTIARFRKLHDERIQRELANLVAEQLEFRRRA